MDTNKVILVLEATGGKHDRTDDALASLLNPRQVSAGKGIYRVSAVCHVNAAQAQRIMKVLNDSRYIKMPS